MSASRLFRPPSVRNAIGSLARSVSRCLWPVSATGAQSPQGVDPHGCRGIQTEGMAPPRHILDIFSLAGCVAFVTGGSRGIGRSTCLALANAGADVMVTDQSNEVKLCKAVVDDIESLGRRASAAICDVRDLTSVKTAVQTCKDKLGHLDILVANAGILGNIEMPEDADEVNWRNVFATNVDGVFHCARAAYPMMKERGRGKVIIISSIASMTGYTPAAAFSSSKGAVVILAKSLASAWAKDNIQVNCVLPGAVDTGFFEPILEKEGHRKEVLDRIPAGRLGEADDVTGAILFFASRASDYCTGSSLVVDGGATLLRMPG